MLKILMVPKGNETTLEVNGEPIEGCIRILKNGAARTLYRRKKIKRWSLTWLLLQNGYDLDKTAFSIGTKKVEERR